MAITLPTIGGGGGASLPQALDTSDSPTFADATLTGDLTLDDGGSIKEAGGAAAITVSAAGQVTKLGQVSPSDTNVLTWDAGNGYWKAAVAAGGSAADDENAIIHAITLGL